MLLETRGGKIFDKAIQKKIYRLISKQCKSKESKGIWTDANKVQHENTFYIETNLAKVQ